MCFKWESRSSLELVIAPAGLVLGGNGSLGFPVSYTKALTYVVPAGDHAGLRVLV